MANYGGNSFPRQSAEVHAERLNIWNYIDHSKLIGVALLPSETYPVGYKFHIGEAVQRSTDGTAPKVGTTATAPEGLLRADVTMAEGGCTLTIVRSGSIRASLMPVALTEAQKAALPSTIDLDYEPIETVSNS